jgi:branched-chain amino acid transport system permease protein
MGKITKPPRLLDFLHAKKFYVLFILILSILAVFLPFFVSEYIKYVIITFLIYGILTSSYNLLMGYTGQLSYCHSSFYGVGAYFSALLTGTYISGNLISRSLSFWVAFPLAGVLSAIVAAGIGYPALRLRGSYFAVTTFFLSWFVYLIFLNWVDVTNGPLGLRNIPAPDPILGVDFSSYSNYYYLTLAVFITTVLFLYYLVKGNFGKILIAIREDETLAESLGINAMKYKILAFTISAFFAGLAGSLFAHFIRYVNPASFSTYESDVILVMTIIGGVSTTIGPIIGAGIMRTLLELLLSFNPALRMILVYACALILVIYEPIGIVGLVKKARAWATAK